MDNHKQKTLLICALLIFLLYVYWPSDLLEENVECSHLQSVQKEPPNLDLNSKYCRQCSSDANSSISVLHLFAALKNGCRQLITIQNGRHGLMTIQNGCQSWLGEVGGWWLRWDFLGCEVMVLDEARGKFEELFLCDKKIGNSVKVAKNKSKSGNSLGKKSVNNVKVTDGSSKKSGKRATKTGKKSASSLKKTDNNVKKSGRSVKKSGGHAGKKSGGKKAGKISTLRKHGNSARKTAAKKSGAKTGNTVQAQQMKTDQKNGLDSSGVVEDEIHGNIDSKSGDDDEDIQEGEEEEDDDEESNQQAGGVRGEEEEVEEEEEGVKAKNANDVDSEEELGLNRDDDTNDNDTVNDDKNLEEGKKYGAEKARTADGNKQEDITDEEEEGGEEGEEEDDDDDDDDDEEVGYLEDNDRLKKKKEEEEDKKKNVDDVDNEKRDEEEQKEENESTSLAYLFLFPLLVISTGASVLELLREKKKKRKVSEEGTDDANDIAAGCSVGRRMSLVDLTVSRHARKEHQIENILKHSGVSTTTRNTVSATVSAVPLLRRSSLAEGLLLQGQAGGHLQGRPLQQRQQTWSPPSPLVRQATATAGRRMSVDYDAGASGGGGAPNGDESPDSRRRVRIIRRH